MSYTTRQLIERASDIRATEYHDPAEKGIMLPSYIRGQKYYKWLNDIKIKASKLPNECPLKKEFNNAYFFKDSSTNTFDKMIGLLESLEEWELDNSSTKARKDEPVIMKKYDVFLSHANADKNEYVDGLFTTLNKLGISIFYDKESIEWGDNFKEKILDGTHKSEFAIIVISENFFGREWTEKELSELLSAQNNNGQKIILPLLHKTTIDDFISHYPQLKDIHVVQTSEVSKEEITILFAKQLIKRLRGN